MSPSSPHTLRRPIALIAAFLALTAALVGCRASESPGGEVAEGDPIVVNGSMPFSGPLAVYGTLSRGLQAHFAMVNAEGGVNGRPIEYQAVDDGYEPARAVTNARRFMERDNAFISVTFGGPPSFAVAPIAEQNEAVQLAIAGNGPLSDIETTPYTRAWFPDNRAEARAVTEYVIEQNPEAKIGVLYINSDTGTDYLAGVREAVEAQSSAEIVQEVTYEPTDATVNAQVNQLRSAGVDTVVAIPLGAIPFQMVQYIDQIGWDPVVTINESSSGIDATMSRMGDAADGLLSAHYVMDPADPQYADDEDLARYREAIAEYGDGADPEDFNTLKGYALGEAIVTVLEDLDTLNADAFLEAWDGLEPAENSALLEGIQMAGGDGGRLLNTFRIVSFDDGRWMEPSDD